MALGLWFAVGWLTLPGSCCIRGNSGIHCARLRWSPCWLVCGNLGVCCVRGNPGMHITQVSVVGGWRVVWVGTPCIGVLVFGRGAVLSLLACPAL